MNLDFDLGTPLYPVLNAYVASSARVSIITGPLGSGKTTASCQRILRHMTEQAANRYGVRTTRFLVCRNTYPDLTTTTIPSFEAFFMPVTPELLRHPETGEVIPPGPKLGKMYGGGEEPPHAEFEFRLPDGTSVSSTVWFVSLDKPKDVRRLLGLEVTGIWLSEVKELDKAVIDMLDLRHGRYPSREQGYSMPTWRGMFGDTNQCDSEHWLHKLKLEQPEGWAFFEQPGGLIQTGIQADGRKTWKPNPLAENVANLPGGLDYYVTGQAGKRDDWINVFLGNQVGIVAGGKAVHPDFVQAIHVAPEPLAAQPRIPLVLGFDFGRTPAGVVLQWWQGAGRWAVLAEFTTEDMSAATFAPNFKGWLLREFPGFASSGMRGWGDPAGDHAGQSVEETPMMILRSHGIPCQPAGNNEPLLRRAALDGPLLRGTIDGRRGILVSPACTVLVKGLAGAWDFPRINTIGIERYSETPAKNRWSHVCEALEYALVGEGEAEQAIQPATTRFGMEERPGQEYAEM